MRFLHVIQSQADCFIDWLAANGRRAIDTRRRRYARFDRYNMDLCLGDNGLLVGMEVIQLP
jgi:hypothetical protein